jgi:tRNA uridine 5-carboxymethylaminomethyl modification enzyme
LKRTLETAKIRGLYIAGQPNGTSGYEEAAIQGLIAGLNAVASCHKLPPVILQRWEAYGGVLIDDISKMETREPYRMFTSRAEHRLLLRMSNADIRLTKKINDFPHLSNKRLKRLQRKQSILDTNISLLNATKLVPDSPESQRLQSMGLPAVTRRVSLAEYLRRPEVSVHALLNIGLLSDDLCSRFHQNFSNSTSLNTENLDKDEAHPPFEDSRTCQDYNFLRDTLYELECTIKYEGYIKKQERQIAVLSQMENTAFPDDFDYNNVKGLSFEGREQLNKFRPLTLGEAQRLQGVRHGDITVLMSALTLWKKKSI